MLFKIKSFLNFVLPKPVRKKLVDIKSKTFDQWQKKKLAKRMQIKHTLLLEKLKCKGKVRVVFLAIHKNVWKVDPVFEKMLKDPFFDPVILICPYIFYGEERMKVDMNEAYQFFQEKDYPTILSYTEEGRWINLDELNTDIVFFSNPHNITRKEYYEDAYLNYLSCYVPYHHEVGSFDNDNNQHNQYFHNAVWKIFSTHEDSYTLASCISANNAKNIIVTGFPAMENLMAKNNNSKFLDVWNNCDSRKRIIWSPHHLIDDDINQSNFLEYAEFFKKLAIENKNKIVWAFKPHPILKSKLYLHKDWGLEKTNKYYEFWDHSDFSQLELGSYEDLFLSSDAMIHDCGSFLAEYMYLKKPVMYILNSKHKGQFFNSFGKKALSACRLAYNQDDISFFLDILLKGKAQITDKHSRFISEDINCFFKEISPSDKIIRNLKDEI